MTVQALIELKGKIEALDNPYLLRFTIANKGLSDDDFVEKFEQDQKDRKEASDREELRKKILSGDVAQLTDEEFEKIVQERNARIVQLNSVQSESQTANANATAE